MARRAVMGRDDGAAIGVQERLRAEVQRRLKECRYAWYLRDVDVFFRGGTLVLEGRVPTFYMKQQLQTLLRGLEGVKRIRNDVAVVSPTGLSSPAAVGGRRRR